MRKIIFLSAFAFSFCAVAYGQSLEETVSILGQVNQMVGGADSSGGSGFLSGFSIWNLIGGLIFGGLGFVAFIYGKKNAEWPTMLIGILLMVYPYFFTNTFFLYVIGIGLTAAIYFFRRL